MNSQRDPAVDCAGMVILVACILFGCVIGGLVAWAVMR